MNMRQIAAQCLRPLLWPNIRLIDDHDEHARQIQADLDAEHYRRQRSRRQIYYPPGTIAPRRLPAEDRAA
jgi:hypothetical protein